TSRPGWNWYDRPAHSTLIVDPLTTVAPPRDSARRSPPGRESSAGSTVAATGGGPGGGSTVPATSAVPANDSWRCVPTDGRPRTTVASPTIATSCAGA